MLTLKSFYLQIFPFCILYDVCLYLEAGKLCVTFENILNVKIDYNIR